MNKYIIYAPHKCGSSILRKMTADITNVNIKPDKEFIIQTDRGEAQLHLFRKFKFSQKNQEEDRLICIPRHPISICISGYYSFGYTHRCPPQFTEVEFARRRKKTQHIGLEGFIENNIKKACKITEHTLHSNYNNKTVIPYELMITNFSDFLKNYLTAINMTSSYQSAYSKWNSEFCPIADRSDLIESGTLKTHKRTTDIYEWKKKLDQNKLQNILKEYPIINEYCELLSTYNL